MYTLQPTQHKPISGMINEHDDVAYIVVFTESCKFVRVDADMMYYTFISANDCIADIIDSRGESLLTDNEKIHAWRDITMYISDASNEFTMPYADAVVLRLDSVDYGVDF
jgi:hypothetical protein